MPVQSANVSHRGFEIGYTPAVGGGFKACWRAGGSRAEWIKSRLISPTSPAAMESACAVIDYNLDHNPAVTQEKLLLIAAKLQSARVGQVQEPPAVTVAGVPYRGFDTGYSAASGGGFHGCWRTPIGDGAALWGEGNNTTTSPAEAVEDAHRTIDCIIDGPALDKRLSPKARMLKTLRRVLGEAKDHKAPLEEGVEALLTDGWHQDEPASTTPVDTLPPKPRSDCTAEELALWASFAESAMKGAAARRSDFVGSEDVSRRACEIASLTLAEWSRLRDGKSV